MTEPMPRTIRETSLRMTDIKPIAKSQPKRMVTPIKSRFFVLRKE